MSNQDLELYKVFHAVAVHGSITRAAQGLYTGQPAVSRSVQRLEERLGTRLFERSSRGVRLTGEGELLFRHVDAAMAELERGEKALARMLGGGRGSITVGISATHYKNIMLPHLKAFRERHPGRGIKILDNSTSYQTLALLEAGKVDMGIISKPLDLQGIAFIPIKTIEEIFIGEPGYVATLPTGDLVELFRRATWIFLEQGNITREYQERYLAKLGVAVRPEIVTSNMDFIVELVKLGIGLGIVFREVVAGALAAGEIIELECLPPIPRREIGIVYRRDRPVTPAVEEFIRYYQGVLAPGL